MHWWITLTSSTGKPRLWSFATKEEALHHATSSVDHGWTLTTPPARREDTSFTPEGLAALATLIRLQEDPDGAALGEGIVEVAEAEALRFGYSETEMEIVSDWITARQGTWNETLAFLEDAFSLGWLARMVAAGWQHYDVNHQPVTDDAVHTTMTTWSPER